MGDKQPRTVERIYDDIYDDIQEQRKVSRKDREKDIRPDLVLHAICYNSILQILENITLKI